MLAGFEPVNKLFNEDVFFSLYSKARSSVTRLCNKWVCLCDTGDTEKEF